MKKEQIIDFRQLHPQAQTKHINIYMHIDIHSTTTTTQSQTHTHTIIWSYVKFKKNGKLLNK